jgi:hypothetical protein
MIGESVHAEISQSSEVVDLAGVVCSMVDETVEPHTDRGQCLELRFVQ